MVERGEIGRYAYNLHVEYDDFWHAGTLVRGTPTLCASTTTASRLLNIRWKGVHHE
jgi:hypothetical protein